MKHLDEIIRNFKILNQRFFSQFCSIEKCNKCPFRGNCIVQGFDDLESDLIKIRAELTKILVGAEGE